MCTRIPAFKEFYSLVRGTEEHQEPHEISNITESVPYIKCYWRGSSQETIIKFSCGKLKKTSQRMWHLNWALRLWKDFGRMACEEGALQVERTVWAKAWLWFGERIVQFGWYMKST